MTDKLMTKLRARTEKWDAQFKAWADGDHIDQPDETLRAIHEDALDQIDELTEALDKMWAAMWNSVYGDGLSVEYAQSVDKEIKMLLTKVRQ